jgi:regulator of sigma E protease
MIPWYIWLIGALGLALLMVVHEGGHFLVARAYGMRVTKFSIGFGPTFFKIVPQDGYFWFTTAADKVRLRLWRHDPEKHGPTIYQVAMIPFLAYVQIAGLNPLEDIDPDDKGSYANASLHGRILTIFGGPLANYLFASVFFFFSFFFGGRVLLPEPGVPVPTDVTVIDDRPKNPRPAVVAGVRTGDRLVEINGVPVKDWAEMAEAISQHGGKAIPVVVERNSERITLTVTPEDERGKGRIGVTPVERRVNVNAKEALILALKAPPMFVKNSIIGLGQWATGKSSGTLSGPVGIATEVANAAMKGWTYLFEILGLLSAWLGAFNLVPIPALDGGRLMFLGYEAATRRRPNARIEAHIHAIGLVMMLGLMVYVTVFNDLRIGAK